MGKKAHWAFWKNVPLKSIGSLHISNGSLTWLADRMHSEVEILFTCVLGGCFEDIYIYRPFCPHKTGVITGSLHGGRACQRLHIMSDTWQYPESVSCSHNCSPLRHYHHMIQVWRPILGRSMICKVILNKFPSFHVYLSYLPKWRAYIPPAFKNYLTQNITVGRV